MFAGVAPGPVAPTPNVERSGPVVLVNPQNGCERYATVDGIGTNCVIVKWAGDPDLSKDGPIHLFDRATGQCIESPKGIMRGYQIHPNELPRFAVGASVSDATSGSRVVFASRAPDGSVEFSFDAVGEAAQPPLPYVRHTPSAPAEA